MFEKRIALEFSNEDRKIIEQLRRSIMGFTEAVAKLDADVKTLIGETNPAATAAAVAAAVAAKDAADAAAVAAIDATVVAAITPAPVV